MPGVKWTKGDRYTEIHRTPKHTYIYFNKWDTPLWRGNSHLLVGHGTKGLLYSFTYADDNQTITVEGNDPNKTWWYFKNKVFGWSWFLFRNLGHDYIPGIGMEEEERNIRWYWYHPKSFWMARGFRKGPRGKLVPLK